MTVKIIDGEEQPALRGCRVVNAVLSGKSNPAQEQGSALTYARRYSLLMAFGLATEDDDAESLTITKEPTIEEAKEYVLTFGKYNGKKLSEVDSSYLVWLRENSNDNYVKKCAELLKPLPNKEEQKEILKLIEELNELLDIEEIDREAFYKHYGVSSNGEMTKEQLQDAITKFKYRGK